MESGFKKYQFLNINVNINIPIPDPMGNINPGSQTRPGIMTVMVRWEVPAHSNEEREKLLQAITTKIKLMITFTGEQLLTGVIDTVKLNLTSDREFSVGVDDMIVNYKPEPSVFDKVREDYEKNHHEPYIP